MKTQWNMRIEQEELDSWKAAAKEDGMLVTEWIRQLCNAELAQAVPDHSILEKGVVTEKVENAPKPKKTCKHGKEKGYHCWQCGGVAQVEA
jgi:hypothetical protein